MRVMQVCNPMPFYLFCCIRTVMARKKCYQQEEERHSNQIDNELKWRRVKDITLLVGLAKQICEMLYCILTTHMSKLRILDNRNYIRYHENVQPGVHDHSRSISGITVSSVISNSVIEASEGQYRI